MATQKIRDIIDRELIMRSNNVNYRQEAAVKGVDVDKIFDETDSQGNEYTVFKTDNEVDSIIFVTVNGLIQKIGEHYFLEDSGTIKFRGVLLDNRTVSIGYMFKATKFTPNNGNPYIAKFKTVNTSGGAGVIEFDYLIEARNGEYISWDIIKDGDSKVIAQGTDLYPSGSLPTWELTPEEFAEDQDRKITFTLIVTYDIKNDPDAMHERTMADTTYTLDPLAPLDLTFNITPDTLITTSSIYIHTLHYEVLPGDYVEYTWKVIEAISGDVIVQGSIADGTGISGQVDVVNDVQPGDTTKQYSLVVSAKGMTHDVIESDFIEISLLSVNDATEVINISAAAGIPLVVTYTLDKLPSITILDEYGELVNAEVIFTGPKELTLTFNIDFVGQLILN